MPTFEPHDPDYEQRVRSSFARQAVMETIGADLTSVAPGAVEIRLPFRDTLTQQHGFLHGGIVTTIVDSACGYAAFSLMPKNARVLTIEYKVNFLSPAIAVQMIARGHVVRAGRTITVCTGDVFALNDGQEKLIATMLATMMMLPESSDLAG